MFTIPAMDCPAEEAVIRNRLGKMRGVTDLSFDLFNRRLTVEHTLESDGPIAAALRGIGMHPKAEGDTKHPEGDEHVHGGTTTGPVATKLQIVLLAASGVTAFAAEIVAWSGKDERSWPVIALAVVSILLGGLPTLRKGLIALRTLTLNINFLMTVAVVGAFAIGEYPEAAMVIFLFAVAELIEAYSLDRARNAVRSLMEMAPDVASVKQPDGSWRETAANDVAADSIVRVRPGERLALDGVVVAGDSAVDQAPITGESVPVDKRVGDQVFAGTINGNGVLEFRTSGGKDQTTLARIIRTVQEAQGSRAPTQRFVDKFARVYTPIVCALALLIALTPWLLFNQPIMPWVYKALVLLVIACPCALVISTPVTIVSGLAAAARRGILVKGGVYLEEGRKLKVIAVDKTGTVTHGQPKLTDVEPLGGRSADEVLRIAASIDTSSDHPVARAVVTGWDDAKSTQGGSLLPVTEFESITGRGVSGIINGETYLVGNHRLAHERGVCSPAVETALGKLENQGKTALMVASSREVLGVLAVADTPRETSIEAIRELHTMGVRTVMLTGDNQKTADAIAKSVGIDDARGDLLPEDKLAAIDEMLTEYGAVGMAGDGVNDAPALAKATIGFAMGAAGTDTALETADVALMKDDLRGLAEFLRLSRRTAAILKQNIGIALATKAVFFALALAGAATLWMAVIADMGASMVVVFNGLRLLNVATTSARLGRRVGGNRSGLQ